jgi:pimeloyl-ACP methyl ester carboxylesterase
MSDTSRAASLVLVHGGGSGPWIFDDWHSSFPGVRVATVDLQKGLDVAKASMSEYAQRVIEAAQALPAPVSVCGWSMGGLVVLQAADRMRPHSVIVIEPSPPGEIQGFDPKVEPSGGTVDPQAVYGVFPTGVRTRLESAFARAERKRGIAVPRLPCRSLVVYGDEFPEERGTRIARLYGSEERSFPGLDHWSLVRDPRVREAIAEFIGASAQT